MRVLIATGNDICRRTLSTALQRLGHVCAAVDDGPAAWDHLVEHGADVVISDWELTGLSGLELCRRLRSRPELGYPYFTMLTAEGGAHAVIAMRAGADQRLASPPSPDDLAASLISAGRVIGLRLALEESDRDLGAAIQEAVDNRFALEAANDRIDHLAARDSLTGLGNSHRLREELPGLQSRLERYGHGFCVAILNMDEFRSYNDIHGHEMGDRLLAEVGRAIISEIRPGDSAYRYGGEEFVIIYPDQHLATAVVGVERLRRRVAAIGADSTVAGSSTISAGVAEAGRTESFADVLKRATDALGQAKQAGRNQVAGGTSR